MFIPLLLVLVSTIAVYFAAQKFLGGKKLYQLDRQNYKKFKLIEKCDVVKPHEGCHTMRFRFGLPEGYALGLPVGKHVSLRTTDKDGNMVIRQYTPTTGQETTGYFDLVIKIYPDGIMGNYLKSLPIGSDVEMRGPNGLFEYFGNGQVEYRPIDGKVQKKSVKHFGMIAGGSGITPMLQIASAINHDTTDPTKSSLIFCNQTEGDIMCRDLLDHLVEKYSNKFDLFYVVSQAKCTNWKGGIGFCTAEMIKQQLPPPGDDTLILLCGPPPMLTAMINHLTGLGYTKDMITSF